MELLYLLLLYDGHNGYANAPQCYVYTQFACLVFMRHCPAETQRITRTPEGTPRYRQYRHAHAHSKYRMILIATCKSLVCLSSLDESWERKNKSHLASKLMSVIALTCITCNDRWWETDSWTILVQEFPLCGTHPEVANICLI